MKKLKLKLTSVMEEVVFGVEDSLVSTMGVLTGVAAGTQDSYTIILTGCVLLTAEALSMAAGSYLSSETEADIWIKQHADDWDKLMRSKETWLPLEKELRAGLVSRGLRERIIGSVEHMRKRWLGQMIRHERQYSPVGLKKPITAAIVMGASYIVAGFVPLSAYVIFEVKDAIVPSIIATIFTLFVFGAAESKLTGRAWWKSGLETVLVASVAAVAAYGIGYAARVLFAVSV